MIIWEETSVEGAEWVEYSPPLSENGTVNLVP